MKPQTIQSMELSRPEYQSGSSFPSPEDLPNAGLKPRSPVLQAGCLPDEPPGKPRNAWHPGLFDGFPAAPAVSPRVCACRLPLPDWADSARLPLSASGSTNQTPRLHPEQCQRWWLTNVPFPAEAREPSPGPPDVQVRLQ